MKSWDCGTVNRLKCCDFQDNYGLAGFKKATSLKYKHPHLKVHNQTNILVSFLKSEGAQTNILFLFEILLLSSTPQHGETPAHKLVHCTDKSSFSGLFGDRRLERGKRQVQRDGKRSQSQFAHIFLRFGFLSTARSRSFIHIKSSLETLFSQH